MVEAFEILKTDHQKVKKILSELLETTAQAVAKRKELFNLLKAELKLHEKIEEKLFYPVMEKKPDAKDLTLEAYEEHGVVDDLVAKIEKTAMDDETWKAKVTVLEECLKHHIKEEENELFPKAEAELSSKKLTEMAEEMKAMKEKAA